MITYDEFEYLIVQYISDYIKEIVDSKQINSEMLLKIFSNSQMFLKTFLNEHCRRFYTQEQVYKAEEIIKANLIVIVNKVVNNEELK